jgi:predicted HicB family RNase H-like nuclease
MMTYKGFVGVATVDLDAKILFGRVVNTRSVITFESATVADLEKEFHDSVDFYIEACEKHGITPEKPVAGNISLRMTPELHAAVTTAAAESGMSVNKYIGSLLAEHVTARHQIVLDSGADVSLEGVGGSKVVASGNLSGAVSARNVTGRLRKEVKAKKAKA